MSAQPSPFDQNAFDRIAFEPIEGLPRTDLVAPRRSPTCEFNDLKAKRKAQAQDHHRRRFGRKRCSPSRAARSWYAADQAAKALQDMAPQTFVERAFVETVSASSNLQPVASVSATPGWTASWARCSWPEATRWPRARRCSPWSTTLDKAVNQAGHRGGQERRGPGQERRERAYCQVRRPAGRRERPSPGASRRRGRQGGRGSGAESFAGEQASFDESSADSAIRSAELGSSANLALQNAQSLRRAVARAASAR
ncbi:MAG: hypothetical protein ACLT98_15070 [Eggerthellaceae bacterium]